MAIKKMHRVISKTDGVIELCEYDFLSDNIYIDTVEIEFDDHLENEHRLKLAEALGEKVKEQENEVRKQYIQIQETKNKIKQLLCLENKPPVFEKADPFDEDTPF